MNEKKLNRRDFLKGVGATVAVAATGSLLSGCAQEKECPTCDPCETPTYDPQGLVGYMKDNPTSWMSVDNGYWSENKEDQPTDEELKTMLDTAMMAQLAVQYSEVYCVVLKDYKDQFDVIGDYWDHSGKAVGASVTEGTATVLFYADKILPQEEHASPYEVYVDDKGEESKYGAYYKPAPTTSYMDTGIAMGWFQFGAHALGYNTHIFGGLYGEAAVNSPNQYIEGKGLTRGWGFVHKYGEDIKTVPLDGNMKLVSAIVVGKRKADVDATAAASMHMRPTNYSFYDGVPGSYTPTDAESGASTDASSGATSEEETKE